MPRSDLERRPTGDGLLGFHPSLDDTLPVDTERMERDSLRAEYMAAREEFDRLTRRMERWDIKPEIYWDWLESQEEFQKDVNDFENACERKDKTYRRWMKACMVFDQRLHLCSVVPIKPSEKGGRIRHRVLIAGSLRIYLGKILFRLGNAAKNLLAMVRREIADVLKSLRDHSRSAIERGLTMLLLQALTGLAATLAAQAIDQGRPTLTPRVLSAGGSSLFVLRI